MPLSGTLRCGKLLALGTGLWGWGVDRSQAYAILEAFVAVGGSVVDTATNYPISKRPEDFGLAVRWLADWVAANGPNNLKILVKVGATDNLGGRGAMLFPSFVDLSEEIFLGRFGKALGGIAIHWDNRDNPDSIAETVDRFVELDARGYAIGFSGVRHPQLYRIAAPHLADRWWIQVKENAATHEARQRYARQFPNARYLAYGINMGGIKYEAPRADSSVRLRGIDPSRHLVARLSDFLSRRHGLRPNPADFNELALSLAWHNAALSGIIVAPRTIAQLEATLRFWQRLGREAQPEHAILLQDIASPNLDMS